MNYVLIRFLLLKMGCRKYRNVVPSKFPLTNLDIIIIIYNLVNLLIILLFENKNWKLHQYEKYFFTQLTLNNYKNPKIVIY